MDETLTKLGSYVASKESRLACAAAVILAELAPPDRELTQQLGQALEHADALCRPFIIEALGRIGTADAAAALVPLIKAEGPAGEEALRAIAHTGSAALKPLLSLLGKVPAALLERIAECAARTGEPTAFSSLLDALIGADIATCQALRNGLRTAMSSFDAKNKERLQKQLERAFQNKALLKHELALIALIKIAGDLGDISLQPYLLDRIGPEHPPRLRRVALLALSRLHFSGEQRAAMAPRLLPLMSERDVGNLAEPAFEALRHATLGSEHQAALRKLLGSPSSRIREFVMQTLAMQGTSRTLHELVGCLDSPERSVREEALSALSRSPAAAGALVERLLALEGGDRATETARALAPQAAHAPRKQLEALAAQYVQLAGSQPAKKSSSPDEIQKITEKRRAIASAFRSANSPALVEAAAVRAKQYRKEGEPERAYELLKSVNGMNGWNDEHRVDMALAGLSQGPKDLARSARSNDQNLRILEEILLSGRKSAKEIAKQAESDPAIDRKGLYYLGFHFVERMQAEREFGQLLLEHLSSSSGRTDEGRQAKEKLVIEGLSEMRGGKAGILEERAKVLMSASEMVAVEEPPVVVKKAVRKVKLAALKKKKKK